MDNITEAIKRGDLERVKEIMGNEPCNSHVMDVLLSEAVKCNQFEMIKHFVGDRRDLPDKTINMLYQCQNMEIINYIVERTIITDNYVFGVINNNRLDILEIILDHGMEITDAIFQGANSRIPVMEIYIRRGFKNINRGLLDLYSLESLKFLIDHGADIHYNGEAVFFDAVINRNESIINYIIEMFSMSNEYRYYYSDNHRLGYVFSEYGDDVCHCRYKGASFLCRNGGFNTEYLDSILPIKRYK